MRPVGSRTRRRLVGTALATVALAAPAVALAAVITVNGGGGDDVLSVRVESPASARVVLNGAQVATAASGDTVQARTGAGSDTMIFDEVEDFELIFSLNAALGAGDDVAVVSGISDSSGEPATTTGTDLQLDLGSGNDRFGLHNYGDTNRFVVNAGAGNDVGRLGYVVSAGSDLLVKVINLGSGRDHFRSADPGASRLIGGEGDDQIRERGGGPDTLFGNKGNDTLEGLAGNDRLIGGEGDDTFHARDGDADVIRCGSGRDRVRADRSDTVSSNCERVRRS
jgi:Ca2+-binding RTX toxin-like protein